MTRRSFIGSAARAAVAAGIFGAGNWMWAGCGTSSGGRSSGQKELVIASWGGAYQEAQRKAFFDPFTKETGIKIIEAGPTDNAKIAAMVESGNVEWDLVDNDMGGILELKKKDFLEPIPYDAIPQDVLDQFEDSDKDPYGFAIMWFSTCIAYRTDAFGGDYPKDWAEFWDVERFPGPRSLQYASNLEQALAADGVPIDQIYPIDIDRAFKKFDEIREHVVKWWETGAVPAQMLSDNEIVLASAYNGRIGAIKEQGAPVDVNFNQGLLIGEYWMIPKGTEKLDLIKEFLAFAAQAEQHVELSKHILYGPANKKAYEQIPPERAAQLPTSPENRARQIIFNAEWHGEHNEEVRERFTSWLLGG
ncbi:extracellular solute-binding protein family 1 [Sphaerobacter thermophilus DSM 20745]|uniref:Extracellular solute-binding protein family 1 n=2 Tax=Sphaerobacter TaxID=2056 RepID=D1C885_SPHTD|nr:extracellular solute-binding protein family 1 [Sphaerobacter thermophilus DSM 20745]